MLTELRASPGFRGAHVSKAADQTAANYSAGVSMAWNQENYDVGGWHDNVTNNSRLTVPVGVTRVRVFGNVNLALVTANVFVLSRLWKGGVIITGSAYHRMAANTTSPSLSFNTSPLDVAAGEYFELNLFVQTDTSVTVLTASSFAIMEVP